MDCITLNSDLATKIRMQTFVNSPIPVSNSEFSLSNTPIKFAEAGYQRSPNVVDDEVECSRCGLKSKGWSGESPLAVHRTMSPLCPFLNTPPTKSSDQTSSGAHTNKISIRRQLFPNTPVHSTPADIDLPYIPKNGGLMLFESHRILTYCDVFSSVSGMYAKSGFVMNKATSKVVCVYCDVQIDFNISKDLSEIDIDMQHTEASPQCPFMMGFDLGNISREEEESIKCKGLNQIVNNIISGERPLINYVIKCPEYEDRSTREGTFLTWPKLLASVFPPLNLVDAGLFYSGFMDKVQCFACGVSLYNWSLEADPAKQHANASPNCHYLQAKYGQDFIQAAQREELMVDVEHSDSEAAASSPDALSTSSSSSSFSMAAAELSPATTPSSTCSSSMSSPGSPILDLEAIKAAMACQYTIERIAHAVRKFFVLSCGRYPNRDLLLGTLKAADENHAQLCQKSQEIAVKDSELQASKSVIQAQGSQLQAKDTEIEATKSELQRTAFELQWRNLEVRSEIEQQFQGQIQQRDQLLQRKDQMLEEKDHVIEEKDHVIENKDVQLELRDRQVEDLQRHIQSLMAELDRRRHTIPFSDDDGGDSGASSDSEQQSTSSSTPSSSSPSESDSETSKPEEFPVAMCKVCMRKSYQVVFLPCKHLCCCEECAVKLLGKNCPVCRGPNHALERVYVM